MPKSIRLHVSAAATGKADGSAAKPFATLEAARDALRKLRRRGPATTAEVLVAPGVYRLAAPLAFTPEDGGTAKHPVTWRGDGGRPLLSGARAISGWSDGTINGRPCWQAVLPEVATGSWWFTQLFVNGRRRLRARLPKRGFHHFAGVPAEEAKGDSGKMFHGAMSALFNPGEVRQFRNLADIDVVVPDHWYENHLRIASVDEEAGVIHFATKGYSRFSRDETGRHTRFRLDHVAEGCTDPGDWYLDRPTGTLSYLPMPGEARTATLVEAPVLQRLLDVQGDALDPQRRVCHLRFEFLDLRHADWELPRNNPGSIQSAFQVPAAVRLVGAEDCALYGCRVSQVSGWGIEVLRGCRRNRVVACAVHDLGGGGVKVGHEGGLTRRWADGNHGAFAGLDPVSLGWGPCREDAGGQVAGRDRAESSETTISDCSIHDGGLIFHSAIGVWVGDASRNHILHNHIWNFSYSGISVGWTWGFAPAYTYGNRIEGNRIHSIGHGVLSDMGAIYTLGRQAGGTISRNYISDVHSYGYGGWGIYPDEGTSWMTIEDNVVCGTKCGGFHQHYGRDNLVRHNLFLDAIENQVQVSRREVVRSVVFIGNVVQGAGSGSLWQGEGWRSARIDGNVYAGDPDRPMLFGGKSWQAWRTNGRDSSGQLADAMPLDAAGASPAVANPAALVAAGIKPKQVAAVVAAAGPRLRDVLPAGIDAIPTDAEAPRPIVEPCLWPWAAEWPTATGGEHPWSKLPSTAPVQAGVAQPVSLTVENRGDAPARGRYSLRVVPSGAARLSGLTTLVVTLKAGGRTQLDTTVTATGKARAFSLEAVASGPGLVDTCLHFSVPVPAGPPLVLPRLPSVPATSQLLETLQALPARPVIGNGGPIKASLRLAVADRQLLLLVDAVDAAPSRSGNLWDGSSVELFIVAAPKSPHRQVALAPAVGGEPAVAQMVGGNGLDPAAITIASARTATGWILAAALPLELLGVGETFAINLVVTGIPAEGQGLGKSFLVGELPPHLDSSGYQGVVLAGTDAG